MPQLLLIVKYSNTVILNNTVEMSLYPGYNEIEKQSWEWGKFLKNIQFIYIKKKKTSNLFLTVQL